QGSVDPERIAWFGVSHGGYAVLLEASTHPESLACGGSEAGPPRGLLGSPAADPRTVTRPLLTVQGQEDRNVRPGSARHFADRAVKEGAPITMIELPGVGHDLYTSGALLAPLVVTFVADCLGVPTEDPVVSPE